MRKILFLVVGGAFALAAGPAAASDYLCGRVYHPSYGDVPYVCDLSTGYVYFPTLGQVTYLPRPAAYSSAYTPRSMTYYPGVGYGSYPPQQQYPAGMWQQGSTVGQHYGGAGAYRNSNVGVG